MPLTETGRAIGEVVELVVTQLAQRSILNVSVGRPEPPPTSPPNPRLNLFLYEAQFAPSLRNTSVFEGQAPQLWLVLRFLITAFDHEGNGDTVEAHRNLGVGLRALQELSFLPLEGIAATSLTALEDNPETLKISFLDASSELLSRVMQGADEKYRFSMAFEIRPVMIAAVEPSSYSLLTGIDYTITPETVIGEEGIHIDVLATMGMRLTGVTPPSAVAGETIVVSGENLTVTDVVARIGPVELPVSASGDGSLKILLENMTVVVPDNISAGQHQFSLIRQLDAGHTRTSNLLVFELLPTVSAVSAGTLSVINPAEVNKLLRGTFEVQGTFLGDEAADVFVALYAQGRVVQLLSDVSDVGGAPVQTRKLVTIPERQAVPPGKYRVIVSVNGSQARQSPELELALP